MAREITKWGASDTGCIFEGHRGVYIYEAIQQLAKNMGWPGDIANVDCEELAEAANEAEDWLNDNIAEEGYQFGWNDGEFFFQSNAWWSEDGD